MRVIARTPPSLKGVKFHFIAEKRGGKAGGEILWRCGNCTQELLSNPEVGDVCPTCESEVVAVERYKGGYPLLKDYPWEK